MKFKPLYDAGAHAPLLIFIPGFMTEPLADYKDPFPSWSEGIRKFCKLQGFSACILQWPAGNIAEFSSIGRRKFDITKSVGSTWNRAVRNADMQARTLRSEIQSLQREIILVGHSLGGRIALRSAEGLRGRKLRSLVALAPAYDISIVKFTEISNRVEKKPIVCYSHQDMTLSVLFTCGQNNKALIDCIRNIRATPANSLRVLAGILDQRASNPALGLVGVPREFESSYISKNTQLRHYEYSAHIEDLLNQMAYEI